VMSSPSLANLPPQHGQALGPAMTTRSRGRCAGNGARTGFLRVNPMTDVVAAGIATASSSAALASSSSSCNSSWSSKRLRLADGPNRCRRILPISSFRTSGSRREGYIFRFLAGERDLAHALAKVGRHLIAIVRCDRDNIADPNITPLVRNRRLVPAPPQSIYHLDGVAENRYIVFRQSVPWWTALCDRPMFQQDRKRLLRLKKTQRIGEMQ
jgi:hypothetical protein